MVNSRFRINRKLFSFLHCLVPSRFFYNNFFYIQEGIFKEKDIWQIKRRKWRRHVFWTSFKNTETSHLWYTVSVCKHWLEAVVHAYVVKNTHCYLFVVFIAWEQEIVDMGNDTYKLFFVWHIQINAFKLLSYWVKSYCNPTSRNISSSLFHFQSPEHIICETELFSRR